MNNFIINTMNSFGYLGILFLITIENIFPPIPSEVILTLGGFMTTQKECTLTLFGVIFSSTVGSIFGAILLYYLGYILNKDRIEKIINSKFGKLYCRFIPIVRSLISIPAGMNKMKFSIFLIYTLIGSLIWNAVLVSLGALVGENYMVVAKIFSKYSKLILFCIILLLIYKILSKIKKKRCKIKLYNK